jgi:hypothetical protein
VVFTVVTLKNALLHRVALLGSDTSEEYKDSIITVTRIDELGKTLTVTSNRRKLRKNSICSQRAPMWVFLSVPEKYVFAPNKI